MELDAMVEIFADLGTKVSENSKRLNDLKLPKPLGRTIGGSALATAGVVTNVTTQQACPAGKMWEVRLAGLFGSDTHTLVGGTPNPSGTTVGSATTPTAGQTITSQALIPGTYTVSWTAQLGGTPSATDVNNFEITLGGTALATSLNLGAVGTYGQPSLTVVVPGASGGGTVAIKAIAAGTSGAVYTGQLTTTQTASGVTADIFAGSEQDVNTSDFTSVFASGVTVPFVKDYGRRHIDAYPGENIYALVTGAATNQQLVIVAVVDEWNYSDAEAQHV